MYRICWNEFRRTVARLAQNSPCVFTKDSLDVCSRKFYERSSKDVRLATKRRSARFEVLAPFTALSEPSTSLSSGETVRISGRLFSLFSIYHFSLAIAKNSKCFELLTAFDD